MSYPTINLSALMSSSLTDMQVDGITWNQTPIVAAGTGKTASSISATLDGFISCPDIPTLAATITAVNATGLISGTDLKVMGIGGTVLHQVLASDCFDGGPHLAFEVLDGEGEGYRRMRCTVNGKIALATLSNFRTRISTKPDGLIEVDQTGTLVANPDPSVLFPAVLATFIAAYPPGKYVTTYETSLPTGLQTPTAGAVTQLTDYTCQYSLKAVQLASALPGGGSVTVVDGEVTLRKETDEQHRITRVTDYSLQLSVTAGGDYNTLVSALRPSNTSNGQIISESVRFSSIHAWRLEYTITQLSSADNDPLLQYSQTIEFDTPDQLYEVYTYPGINPLAVPKPSTFGRVSQSGSMMGLAKFLAAPDPVGPYFISQPSVSFTDVSTVEKKTDWKYEMLDLDGSLGADIATLLAAMGRPTTVQTVGGSNSSGGTTS